MNLKFPSLILLPLSLFSCGDDVIIYERELSAAEVGELSELAPCCE